MQLHNLVFDLKYANCDIVLFSQIELSLKRENLAAPNEDRPRSVDDDYKKSARSLRYYGIG